MGSERFSEVRDSILKYSEEHIVCALNDIVQHVTKAMVHNKVSDKEVLHHLCQLKDNNMLLIFRQYAMFRRVNATKFVQWVTESKHNSLTANQKMQWIAILHIHEQSLLSSGIATGNQMVEQLIAKCDIPFDNEEITPPQIQWLKPIAKTALKRRISYPGIPSGLCDCGEYHDEDSSDPGSDSDMDDDDMY